MRPIRLGALAGLAGALLAAAAPPALAPATAAAPARADRYAAEIERDAAEALGRSALEELRAARTSLLVRGPVSFPYMVRQPDGTWRKQRPVLAAAMRTERGWIRLSAAGRRDPFDSATGRELDRLLALPALWAEPRVANPGCTDPSGILLLVRHRLRERVSAQPCGFAGATGQAARLVLAGRITDWTTIPAGQRPPGMPIARFDERVEARFRSMSGLYEERIIAIRSRAEWEGQWRRITARQGEPGPPPFVDFDREMLLMAAMGPQRSGGYRVVIDKVIEQPHDLLAFVRFVSPGRGCGAIAAVTSPVDIVRLPASAKPVRWATQRHAADCR